MKKTFFYALAALSLVATSCNDENDWLGNGSQSEGRIVTLSASIAGEKKDARSTFDVEDNVAVFKWAANDAISVFLASPNENTAKKFTLTTGGGTSAGEFEGELDTEKGESMGSLAYYPYHADHKSTTFHLPAEYGGTSEEYVENTNAAYRAEISEGSATFKSIAGVLYVKSKVPVGVDRFVLTANGKKISGDFTIDASGTDYVINMAEGDNTNNSVTYLFKADDSKERYMTFYIPMPVGTYSDLKVELKQGDVVIETKSCTTDKVINRGRLVILEELNAEGYEDVDYTKTTTDDGKVTYTVYTPTGLQKVNELVNADLDANITLGADIKLPIVEDETGFNWTPIGDGTKGYHGTFDGNNKEIHGLTIYSSNQYVGLIGYLGTKGEVKNVILKDCKVTSKYGVTSGVYGTAGIAGLNSNKISGCKVSGTVTGLNGVGGVVGWNNKEASISGCFVEGLTVNGATSVGGVLGQNAGASVENCHAVNIVVSSTGNSTGGIIGKTMLYKNPNTNEITDGEIINCTIKNSKISSSGREESIGRGIGGVVGYSQSANDFIMGCIADNCEVSGNYYVGGVVGWNGGVTMGCYAKNMKLSLVDTRDEYKETIGGIAGTSGSGDFDKVKIIGCYAYNCTNNSEPEEVSDANAIGFNSPLHFKVSDLQAYYYATASDCYFSGSDGTNVSLVKTVDTKTTDPATNGKKYDLNITQNISWAIAIEAMNAALKANDCHYKWTGTATAPELTPHIWSDTE